MSENYNVDHGLSNVSFDDYNESEQKAVGWNTDGQKNTWNDRYMARKVVFPDGQMEVTVCREKHFIGPAYTGNKRTARGESENRERNESVSAAHAQIQRIPLRRSH